MKKSLSVFVAIFGTISLTPLFAFAQNAQGVLGIILGLINTIITILMVAAIAYFIFGVVKYIVSADKEEGKKVIINGLIGLFVIVAFWGIIKIVQNTFGLDNNNQIQQQDIACIQGINC